MGSKTLAWKPRFNKKGIFGQTEYEVALRTKSGSQKQDHTERYMFQGQRVTVITDKPVSLGI